MASDGEQTGGAAIDAPTVNHLAIGATVFRLPGSTPDTPIADLAEPLLDLLPGALYVCDRHGVIVQYNRMAAELWGRAPRIGDPAERFCGALRLYRLDGGPLAHDECPMADVLETGVPVRNAEVVIERPDGGRVVALVSINPLRNSVGEIVGAVNCFRDITEHRIAEEHRRQAETRSRAMLEALPAAVYTTDADGRITFYNQAAVELWGRRPELGQSDFCGAWKLFWPDGRPMPHDECPMAVALKERRPIRGLEAIAERPDGSRVPFIPYPTPLFDDAGELTGGLNMLVDISERRGAEEASRHLAAIVASSQDAIISKGLDGVISSWNEGAERLFGYSAEEMIGRSVTTLIPLDRSAEETSIIARIRAGERVEHYETVRQRKDGSLIDISLTVSPIRAVDGTIVGASKIARDITERRQAQAQRELLLREMNHRVKNLFAVASGVVALSARSAESPRELAAAVQERLDALARAHSLAVPPTTAVAPGEQPTTLHALIGAIASPYDRATPTSQPRVHIEGPDLAISSTAMSSLALLLHEFATNAAKYGSLSAPDGYVDIVCAEVGERYVLTWTERGGPPVVEPPSLEGFGSVMSRAALRGELAGEISRRWDPEGLVITLSFIRGRSGA